MDTETFNPEQNSKIIIPLKTHYHIKMEEPENNLDYDTFKKTINIVNLSYRNCKFDPISVKSNEEAKHLNIYFKYKIKERELKDQSENGRSAGSQFYPSSAVVRYFFCFFSETLSNQILNLSLFLGPSLHFLHTLYLT